MILNVGLCWIMLDYVGLCSIMLDYVGLCWIMLDYVGFMLNLNSSNQTLQTLKSRRFSCISAK
jgi:hypothetical protein